MEIVKFLIVAIGFAVFALPLVAIVVSFLNDKHKKIKKA
jgi:hypothetical protein